jgi:hypothetical protein
VICKYSFRFHTYTTFLTKLCKQQAKVIQHHENIHVHNIGQGEARHRKYKRLKLVGGQAYDQGESVFRLRNFNIINIMIINASQASSIHKYTNTKNIKAA